MNAPLYEVMDLAVSYRGRGGSTPKLALNEVSLAVDSGETLGVVGESGSGKTSLANAIMGLVPAFRGVCRFRGTDISTFDRAGMMRFRKAVQMVFQDPFGSLNPRLTVGSAIAEVVHVHDRAAGADQAAMDARVAGLLGQVELPPSYASRYPHELSGGQRQRVVLARALAVDPVLLVADEPVSALDVLIQKQVLALLSALQRERNMALILIAHDLAVVHSVCSRWVVLYGGMVMESGPAALLASPANPYTRDLLAAVPNVRKGLARERKVATTLPKEEENGSPQTASGCPYRRHCSLAAERCARELPALVSLPGGRFCRCHFALSGGTPGHPRS